MYDLKKWTQKENGGETKTVKKQRRQEGGKKNSKEIEEERKENETIGKVERTNKVRNRAKQKQGRRIGTWKERIC